MTPDRRQYRHPPIAEALCEFQFAGGAEWDPFATPAAIRERLAKTYPGKVKLQNVLSAHVVAAGEQPGPGVEMTQGFQRVQFPTEDEKKLVSVAPGVLSIHVLRPYSGWEEFRSRISEALQVYVDVCRPQAFTRIGVRYINQIALRGPSIPLEEHFQFRHQPEGLPETVAAFVHRSEHLYRDGVKLVLTFASLPSKEASLNQFLLDLDVIAEAATDPRPLSIAMETVDDLRQRERVAFEATITDKLRASFNAAE